MTTPETIVISADLGMAIGMLIVWWAVRKQLNLSSKALHEAQKVITELEAWNTTALNAICELEDEKQVFKIQKEEAERVYVVHCLHHVCRELDEDVLEAEFLSE